MEYKLRASSIGSLFDCAMKWEFETHLGNRGIMGARAYLGISLHHSTAVFDKARMLGDDVSVDDAAGAFVDALRNPEEEVDWKNSDITIKKAEEIGLACHSLYCFDVSP